jgi:hypothetical protein
LAHWNNLVGVLSVPLERPATLQTSIQRVIHPQSGRPVLVLASLTMAAVKCPQSGDGDMAAWKIRS